MKILVIAARYPMFDRDAGSLRLYNIIKIISRKHAIYFCAYAVQSQVHQIGENNTAFYRKAIENMGVAICDKGVINALKRTQYDAIFLEFYHAAHSYLNDARFWQRNARVVVDTVDVYFKRLFSKASLTQKEEDFNKAREVKSIELASYKKADIVIAVTDTDKQTLLTEGIHTPIEIIPNIHHIHNLAEAGNTVSKVLLFIGGFKHEPNIDAMLYFCKEALPLVKEKIPDIRLTIIGDSPPKEILSLANNYISIIGYAPNLKRYFESSYISIAPLRYGAGMKGKIGEAMGFGLPVVTTSVGIEGFCLTPGENVLVGDNPHDFAKEVVNLCQDKGLYERIRINGWRFVKENYSEEMISERIYSIFEWINSSPLRKLSRACIFGRYAYNHLSRYLLWLFRR